MCDARHRLTAPLTTLREVAHTSVTGLHDAGTLKDEGTILSTIWSQLMTTIRTTLRRLFAGGPAAEDGVHFHRRGGSTEPCYDRGCTIPRLKV